MKRTVLIFGLIAGFINVLWMLSFFVIWKDTLDFGHGEISETIGYAEMVLSFSVIFFAIRAYRDKQLNGEITFGKAFKTGLYITLIASAMYGLAWAIISKYFYPDFFEVYGKHQMETMRAGGMSEADISIHMDEMKKWANIMKNPFANFFITGLIEPFPVGLIITLICAAILKKKHKAITA